MSIVEKAMQKLERSGEHRHEPRPGPLPLPGGDAEPPAAPAAGDDARPGIGRALAAPLVHIDFEMLRRGGLYPEGEVTSRVADEFRRVKRPLLANAFGRGATRGVEHGNLIMIGSALPGEGKTFTTFNLALSIAQELERTVLLVDADVAKPHISRALGLAERPGLIDVLLDEDLDLQDVILSTDIESLKILPAGPVHRQATELLASERMERLVAEMGERYPDRVVIFDTPPLLATTEAQVMAGLMGQIVIVVHAGKTAHQAVQQGLETLDAGKVISLVLNRAASRLGDDYYGSYYGYE